MIPNSPLAAFVDIVHSSNGNVHRATDDTVTLENNSRRKKSSRGAKKTVSVVPSHFIQTDVSQVKGETSIFSNMIFCILLPYACYIIDAICFFIVGYSQM